MQDHFTPDSFYWFCALTGFGLFLIQFCLNLVGIGNEESVNDAIHFKWLSRQALTGFLLMFGLSALTCEKEFGIVGDSRLSSLFQAGWERSF